VTGQFLCIETDQEEDCPQQFAGQPNQYKEIVLKEGVIQSERMI
jgi:hypothetical protein